MIKIKEIVLCKKNIRIGDDIIFKNEIILILDKENYDNIRSRQEDYHKLKFMKHGVQQKWDNNKPIYSFVSVGWK